MPAGLRQPAAALPRPSGGLPTSARSPGRARYLARSGKIGWFSSIGPNRAPRSCASTIIDEEDRMRIAHIHRRCECSTGAGEINRPGLQFDIAGIGKGSRRGMSCHVEFRRAHIHGKRRLVTHPCFQHAGRVSSRRWSRARPPLIGDRRTRPRRHSACRLPQAPASEPSVFMIRMKASAPGPRGSWG